MPAVEVNGLSLFYETVGSGPAVLLIHGLGSSTLDWERQVPALEGAHTVTTVDLRGHGQSEKPPGPYSIEAFAGDVAGLVDQLGLGPVAVVGISLGGMVGFQLAADRPDLVDRLMAVNAVQNFEIVSFAMRAQVLVRKLITLFAGMEKIGEVLADRLFPEEGMERERTLMVERWKTNDKAAYRASFQAILDWSGVVEEMRAFERPVLVVASDQDYTTVESKQPWVERMPTAQMVVIEKAHHAVPVERPEAFNEVLEDFLASRCS